MELDGIHHITCITADAPGNVDFYARILGLRLVKKTVNFDAPDVYHLYYGDETGAPGSILTFFEFPDAAPGRAGDGMIHRLIWRVASEDSLAFWSERLAAEGIDVAHDPIGRAITFEDPEGLALEFAAVDTADEPLRAHAEDIPPKHALLGFEGVRAYGEAGEGGIEDRLLTEGMGFERTAPGVYTLQGRRRATYTYDDPPAASGLQGAGTVHHIAWCDRDDEHAEWRQRVAKFGQHPTPVIDREYFLSIYYRVPSGVLFELATPSPGFAVDEDPAHLGEALKLPPQHEHLREQLEHALTPLTNPRAKATR
ncbi:MAG TPA: VOC family protein [Solirubrobacteraceae bacterium]|nr:VOC family protein [Solirubrobacteraceae bacterium]